MPTFTAKFLRDGSTALQCRETGMRYIVGPQTKYGTYAYRNGEMIFTATLRAAALNAIESDAKWAMRCAR